MIVENIQSLNLINGVSLFIKDVKENDFERIISLLNEMGLSRDIDSEKRIHESSKKEFERFLKFNYDSKFDLFRMKLRHFILVPIRKFNGPRMINSIFSNNESFFSSGYLPKEKLLTIVWKSKTYSIDDFASLIWSN
jgi:hypothetical protein